MTPEELYHFDLRGYVVIPAALSADEVTRLRGAVESVKAPPPGSDVMSQRISDLLDRHPAFLELLAHPVGLSVVKAVIGKRARIDHTYAIVMDQGLRGLGPHGGGGHWDPGQFYVWKEGRMRNGLCVLSYALVDSPAGAGGFGCVPGSHKANLHFPGGGANALVEEVAVRAGDLLVFTEALTHCTIDWQGPGRRIAVLYKYSPGNSAWSPSAELGRVRARPGLTRAQRALLQPPHIGGFEPFTD